MKFHYWLAAAFFGGLALLSSTAALAQQKKDLTPRQKQLIDSIHWQDGPCDGKLGAIATVKVPAGYHFVDAAGARAYLELLGNPPSNLTVGVLEPVGDENRWLVEFSYEDVGYVKDDEKDKIDADAILSSIKEGSKQANKQRAQMGAAALEITGWEKPPFYDPRTNRLTWAIRGQTEGMFVVNYNTRLLGRGGVMSANLIVSPQDLETTLPLFDKLLTGYNFASGQSYAEFRPGDKVAEYGLAALVAGGALAVAAKTGLLGKLIKPIILGVLVLGGFFAKFFRSIFGKKDSAA